LDGLEHKTERLGLRASGQQTDGKKKVLLPHHWFRPRQLMIFTAPSFEIKLVANNESSNTKVRVFSNSRKCLIRSLNPVQRIVSISDF
jgi:hypothetical protein